VSGTRSIWGWTPKLSRGVDFDFVRLFLRLLGAVYFVAFVSFGIQAQGLLGARGILPYREYLTAVREALHASAYWNAPTLLWVWPTDTAMSALWLTGCLWALVAVFGRWQRAAMMICFVIWLSLCTVGQDFYSFQWDILLSEAGFLAIFAAAERVRIWLFRWLLFRLLFFSGMVKLLSGDSTWRHFTALTYHYYTQPLPTPLAWYMQQLPQWFQRASVGFVFAVELAVPFLFFAPRPLRHIAAWLTVALQVLILATGNYTFFNYLTIALSIWLFIEPKDPHNHPWERTKVWRPVTIGLASLIGLLSGLVCIQLITTLPPGGETVLRIAEPFRIVNTYGLFAMMTTAREEIVIEGSDDGVTWKEYEFRYKPGNVYRAPPIVAPFQPRLDWQMWFAALGSYRENRWFINLMMRILQGEPGVLRLLSSNPFPKSPPHYVRAVTYDYTFTTFGDRAWWTRKPLGTYLPPVSLR
jgi:hypothetical protein